mgnify:CR=1 FL=1
MRFDQHPHDVQPESKPAGAAGLVAPVKSFEEQWQIIWRNSGAGIVHADARLLTFGLNGDRITTRSLYLIDNLFRFRPATGIVDDNRKALAAELERYGAPDTARSSSNYCCS